MSTPTRRRHGLLAVGWLLAGGAAVLLVLVLLPQLQATWTPLALAASFAFYGLFAWLLAVPLLWFGGQPRGLTVIPLAGLLAHAVAFSPYLPHPWQPDEAPARLGVATANLHFGGGDLSTAPALLDAQVLVLTEVTTANMAELQSSEWTAAYPYRIGRVGADTGTDPHGTMILSSYPLAELGVADRTRFVNVAARVATPDGPVVVVGAHPQNPMGGTAGWLSDAAGLVDLITASRGEDPVVVAGDFNAVLRHDTMDQFVALGLTDAAAASGDGWQPTWPADRWFPPVIPIDHVLVSDDFAPSTVHTVRVTGTDHLGLVAELARSR